jgi:hypothetical protein
MNLAKVQLKVDLFKDMGRRFAKKARAAADSQLRQEGARDALREASKKIGDLGAHLDEDMESGLVAQCMADPKEMEKYLKRYFKRAAGVCVSMADQANSTMILAGGRAKAHEADGRRLVSSASRRSPNSRRTGRRWSRERSLWRAWRSLWPWGLVSRTGTPGFL